METPPSSNHNEEITLNENVANQLAMHQNFPYAIVGGILAILVGAVLWAFITISINFQIGFMAIGVGALIGLAVQFFGLGTEKKFGVLAAVLSFFGCLFGNLLSQVAFIAQEQSMSYLETLSYLNPKLIGNILIETFSFIDLIFYGFAISAGYALAFRKVSPSMSKKFENKENSAPPYQKIRLLSIIISVLILSFVYFKVSNGVNGHKIYYYDSGKILSEGELVKSKLNGKWTYYDENGNITSIGNYNKGVADGKWEWFDNNNNLTRTGNYKNGLENGEWITYYSNKQICDSGTYVNGRKNGYWIHKYENGNLAQCGNLNRDCLKERGASFLRTGANQKK